MDFNSIREKHNEFVYKSFEYTFSGDSINIKFHFHVSPDIDFYPTLEIPNYKGKQRDIDNFVFHLGLIEMISYWKATCSPIISIESGHLNSEQLEFLKDLMIHGLGEFFYENKINFNIENFIDFKIKSDKKFMPLKNKYLRGNLILIGGGKDSAVTSELLKDKENTAMLLNPTGAAIKTANIAGFKNQVVINRTIDKKLIHLNEEGYLNGHTPFSAYLAFLSLLVAEVWGFESIIVSNEKSAGEGSVDYLGLEVNHQYSKSYRFEKMFRDYAKKYISNNINYFSFLRPLSELQIAALFVQTDKYDLAFNSCNKSRNEYWCGECAKCAFVYLIMYGLISDTRRRNIFGEKDFFENDKIKSYIKDLTGNGMHKPLDCVGTEEECNMAVKLIDQPNDKAILERIRKDWSEEHFLTKEYEDIIRINLKNIKL